MIRAFSIGLSIATMRLIFIPALIVLGTDDETVRNLSIISFSVSFVVHALFAEYWIRRTGKNKRDMDDESGLLVSGS